MKDFKNYTQQYEMFYGGEKKNFKLENVSLYNNKPESLDIYATMLRKTSVDMERISFPYAVKLFWLFCRFKYNGFRHAPGRNGTMLDMAFSYYLRKHGGTEHKVFFGKASTFNKILTYIEDFFPNFNESDPFIEDFEYPFVYMTFGCLALVYRMDERLDLLKHGEEKAMNYGEFMDYIVNYINCYNEEYGKKYIISAAHAENAPLNIKKYEERKFKTSDSRRIK